MNLQEFNTQDKSDVAKALFQCCGSNTWVDKMMEHFPFTSEKEMIELGIKIWYDTCVESDWRASFTQHPKIGDTKNFEAKFAATQHLAGKEQAGVQTASKSTIQRLVQANKDYESKNDFIFIVCATGKTADEMLRLLEDRLKNTPEEEVHIAMGEQAKITLIRFKKLMPGLDWSDLGGSQFTTHVLDTSLGAPGRDLTIKLQQYKNEKWQTISQGVTNKDGRVADLLPFGKKLKHINHQIIFDTETYFQQNNIKGFYPEVAIQFTVLDNKHYHVPLLLNPFGYSTYRGS